MRVNTLGIQSKGIISHFVRFIRPSGPVAPVVAGVARVAGSVITKTESYPRIVRSFLSFYRSSILVKRGIVFSCDFMGYDTIERKLAFRGVKVSALGVTHGMRGSFRSGDLNTLYSCCRVRGPTTRHTCCSTLTATGLCRALTRCFRPRSPGIFRPLRLRCGVGGIRPTAPGRVTLLRHLARRGRLVPS